VSGLTVTVLPLPAWLLFPAELPLPLLFYKAISISSEKTRVSDATYTSGVTVSVTIAVTVAVAEEAVSRASSRVGD
jgi:hypothetical protein